jgi:hypothetical protein
MSLVRFVCEAASDGVWVLLDYEYRITEREKEGVDQVG